MVTSVPAWFGRKAPTRKPAAVDLTITYDHSVSNDSFIRAFRELSNIKVIEAELEAENIGTSTFENRYSLCGFEFHMQTLVNQNPQTWVTARDLKSIPENPNSGPGTIPGGIEWKDSRNVDFLGSSDEDETGAIYNLATKSRTRKALVERMRDYPRERLSWPENQFAYGPEIFSEYRSKSDNVARIIISQSTEEAKDDFAIQGTYGIANGPIDSQYNFNNTGTSTGGDNNTFFRELDDAMRDPGTSQILVFIDGKTTTCTDTEKFKDDPNIDLPEGYEVFGAVYSNVNLASDDGTYDWEGVASVIYGPPDLSSATIDDLRVIPANINSIEAPGLRRGPGQANRTNTGYYAALTKGATFNLLKTAENFPLTFQILGRTLGRYLYETTL